PVVLARVAGQAYAEKIGTGESTPEQYFNVFIKYMNTLASEYQWKGASFTRPSGAGRISPRQAADLLKRGMGYPDLAEILGARTALINVENPNGDREFRVTYDI